MYVIVVLFFFYTCVITFLTFNSQKEGRKMYYYTSLELYVILFISLLDININSRGKTGIEYYSREIIYRLQFNRRHKTDLNCLIMFD